jgi:hypothetical protein
MSVFKIDISTVYRYLRPDNYSDALSLRYHPRQKFTQKIEKDNVLQATPVAYLR